MRLYQIIKVLAKKYSIYLLVLNFGFRNKEIDLSELDYCKDAAYIPVENNIMLLFQRTLFKISPILFFALCAKAREGQFITRKQIKQGYQLYMELDFEAIHIFRLYMAPFVQQYIDHGYRGTIHLDLDDIESVTRTAISNMYAQNGDMSAAKVFSRDSKEYEKVEEKWLPMMDRVFVCKEIDRKRLIEKFQLTQVEVLPNVVELPKVEFGNRKNSLFTFLFVGVLDYFPNQEGLIYFCEQILPIIKTFTATPFKVRLVGNGEKEALIARFAHLSEIEVVGFVPNIQQAYTVADAVIVPVRVGGGTRIKILEAFSFRLPVVSTSIGAEGIEVRNHFHLLIGDSPDKFARACVQLLEDDGLGTRLSQNGYALLKKSYLPAALDSVLIGTID